MLQLTGGSNTLKLASIQALNIMTDLRTSFLGLIGVLPRTKLRCTGLGSPVSAEPLSASSHPSLSLSLFLFTLCSIWRPNIARPLVSRHTPNKRAPPPPTLPVCTQTVISELPHRLEVLDELVIADEPALMRCLSHGSAGQQWELRAWLRDEHEIQLNQLTPAGQPKYLVLADASLLIPNASRADQGHYRCRLSLIGHSGPFNQPVLTSEPAGRLLVEERAMSEHAHQSNAASRPLEPVYWARQNQEVRLCLFPGRQLRCAAWWQERAGRGREPLQVNSAAEFRFLGPNCLQILDVQLRHAGRFGCEPAGGSGAGRARLLVGSDSLGAQIQALPMAGSRLQPLSGSSSSMAGFLVGHNSSLQLNCSVTGWPYDTIAWFRDGHLLLEAPLRPEAEATGASAEGAEKADQSDHEQQPARFQLIEPHLLQVNQFGLSERGLYQCLVFSGQALQAAGPSQLWPELNGLAGAGPRALNRLQAALGRSSSSAPLQLEAQLSRPQLTHRFGPQTLASGAQLTLECGFQAVPEPRVLWLLDEHPILPGQPPPELMAHNQSGQAHLLPGSSWWPEQQPEPSDQQDWASDQQQLPAALSADQLLLLASDQQLQHQHHQHHSSLQLPPIRDPKFQVSSQPVNGILISRLQVSQLAPADSGLYKCVAMNALGKVEHAAQLAVPGGPQVRTYQLTRLNLVVGSSVSLQCPIVGFPAPQLQWSRQGRPLPANHRQRLSQTGRLELTNLDRSLDSGLYTCALPGSASNNTSLLRVHLDLQVRLAPQIDAQTLPEMVQASEGQRASLICSLVQGEQPTQLRWFRRLAPGFGPARHSSAAALSGAPPGFELVQNSPAASEQEAAPGSGGPQEPAAPTDAISIHNLEDSSLLTFKRVQRYHAGFYLCLAQNEAGRALRLTRLQVGVAPSWATEPPAELGVVAGSRLVLDCAGSGAPAPSAQWRRGLAPSPDSGALEFRPLESQQGFRARVHPNGSLALDLVEPQDAGVYLCELSNGQGAGLSKQVRLRVHVAPHFGRPSSRLLARSGASAELKCLALGDQPMLIGWRRGSGEPLREGPGLRLSERRLPDGSLESSLHLSPLNRTHSGLYLCLASNQFGTQESSHQLLVQEPPWAPNLLRPVRCSARQASLAFAQPFTGNSPILKYEIHFRLQARSPEPAWWLNATGNTSESWQQVQLEPPPGLLNANQPLPASEQANLVTLNLCCLQPYSPYLVRVRAVNELGAGQLSEPVSFRTHEEPIGGPPLEVRAEPTGAHSLKLTWRPPSRSLQHGPIRGYYVGYRPATPLAASGAVEHQSALSDEHQFQYKNVQVGPSEAAEGAPLEPASPGRPGSASDPGERAHWTHLTGLRRKTAYALVVQAYNELGAGPRSDPLQASTLDAAPPMAPLARVLSVSHHSALFVWSARHFSASGGPQNASEPPSGLDQAEHQLDDDDDDPQAFLTLHFRSEPWLPSGSSLAAGAPEPANELLLQQQQQQAGEWQQRRLKRRQAQPYLLQHLRCGSRHSAYLTATNSLGQSEPGEQLSFSTLGAAPLVPGNPRDFIQLNSSTGLTLRLTSWHDSGCPIAAFLLKYRASGQLKWTQLEHQMADRSVGLQAQPGPLPAPQLHPQQQPQPQPQPQPPRSAPAGLLTLGNLQPGAIYRLLAEASSEAGSTLAEYEVDTGNLTCQLLSVNTNGLSEPAEPSERLLEGLQERRGSGSGASSTGGPLQLGASSGRYSLGVWSLSLLLVLASLLVAGASLALGLRSLARARPKPSQSQSPSEPQAAEPHLGAPRLGWLLWCGRRTGWPASGASSSSTHSSRSSNNTCYQIPAQHLTLSGGALDPYCRLALDSAGLATPSPLHPYQHHQCPSGLTSGQHQQQLPLRQLFTGPSSASSSDALLHMSQLGAHQAERARHALTLGRLAHPGAPSEPASAAHCAATLGRRQAAALAAMAAANPTSSFLGAQSNKCQSAYGRLAPQTGLSPSEDQCHSAANYQLLPATLITSSTNTSGYETGTSMKLNDTYAGNDSHYQLAAPFPINIYGMTSNASGNLNETNLFEQPASQTAFDQLSYNASATNNQPMALESNNRPKGMAAIMQQQQQQHSGPNLTGVEQLSSSVAYGMLFGPSMDQQQHFKDQQQQDHLDQLDQQLQLLAGQQQQQQQQQQLN